MSLADSEDSINQARDVYHGALSKLNDLHFAFPFDRLNTWVRDKVWSVYCIYHSILWSDLIPYEEFLTIQGADLSLLELPFNASYIREKAQQRYEILERRLEKAPLKFVPHQHSHKSYDFHLSRCKRINNDSERIFATLKSESYSWDKDNLESIHRIYQLLYEELIDACRDIYFWEFDEADIGAIPVYEEANFILDTLEEKISDLTHQLHQVPPQDNSTLSSSEQCQSASDPLQDVPKNLDEILIPSGEESGEQSVLPLIKFDSIETVTPIEEESVEPLTLPAVTTTAVVPLNVVFAISESFTSSIEESVEPLFIAQVNPSPVVSLDFHPPEETQVIPCVTSSPKPILDHPTFHTSPHPLNQYPENPLHSSTILYLSQTQIISHHISQDVQSPMVLDCTNSHCAKILKLPLALNKKSKSTTPALAVPPKPPDPPDSLGKHLMESSSTPFECSHGTQSPVPNSLSLVPLSSLQVLPSAPLQLASTILRPSSYTVIILWHSNMLLKFITMPKSLQLLNAKVLVSWSQLRHFLTPPKPPDRTEPQGPTSFSQLSLSLLQVPHLSSPVPTSMHTNSNFQKPIRVSFSTSNTSMNLWHPVSLLTLMTSLESSQFRDVNVKPSRPHLRYISSLPDPLKLRHLTSAMSPVLLCDLHNPLHAFSAMYYILIHSCHTLVVSELPGIMHLILNAHVRRHLLSYASPALAVSPDRDKFQFSQSDRRIHPKRGLLNENPDCCLSNRDTSLRATPTSPEIDRSKKGQVLDLTTILCVPSLSPERKPPDKICSWDNSTEASCTRLPFLYLFLCIYACFKVISCHDQVSLEIVRQFPSLALLFSCCMQDERNLPQNICVIYTTTL